ncbi:Thioredoxin-like protein 1 [Ceratocystis pirilliformis]|uniref:Thioredoxin-like protein 1 n=1 Tax=Ceratocystis pirilliformis TaxID=259994 RepID=A0ABR3YTQ0_9PEZI
MTIVEIESLDQIVGLVKNTATFVVTFYKNDCQKSNTLLRVIGLQTNYFNAPGNVAFGKVNVDLRSEIAAHFNIIGTPSIATFLKGKLDKVMKEPELKQIGNIGRELRLRARISDQLSGGGPSEPEAMWNGASIARGYADITGSVDCKGVDLLNSDDSARKLLSPSKPSALRPGSAAAAAIEERDWVESSVDQQLLLYTPLDSVSKLHTIQITSLPPKENEEDDAEIMRPKLIYVYINQPHNLDFNEADDLPPTQAITLADKDWNDQGTANIPLRFVKFQKITSIVLYFVEGDGESDITRIDRIRYIGEVGESRKVTKLEKIEDH